ncbi:hypothetical protein JZ751_001334 [Albula glossodonta]|uniref:THD domain-containing protein n=1 Tax=Albula glossodonta TaxID=121402 RepID=A0A8T2PTI5_9TELE|nr:hypothetical protein JZ751_001334 [Albula glossodonta]
MKTCISVQCCSAGAEMSKLFQFPSSKASMFLAAYNSTPENGKVGVILWREESGLERNMSLSKNGAQIRVNDQGFYLVFVQASFRVPNVNRENLWLKLVVHYPESHNQYSAVFTTHVGTQSSDEIDVVLNKPVLVWLRPGNYLTVLTHPFDLVERESNPSSTFLTVFKYSD